MLDQLQFPIEIAPARGCYVLKHRAVCERAYADLRARVEATLEGVSVFDDRYNLFAVAADALDECAVEWYPSYLRQCARSLLNECDAQCDGTFYWDGRDRATARELAHALVQLADLARKMMVHESWALECAKGNVAA